VRRGQLELLFNREGGPSDRVSPRSRCSPHLLRDFPPLRILAAENLGHNREYQEYLLRPTFRPNVTFAGRTDWRRIRGSFPITFAFPQRAQNPMQTATLPDISVDFMTWLNTELRKRIEDDENSRTQGLVNRLKNYFGRPVETETDAA
jgi:hypothetical protein